MNRSRGRVLSASTCTGRVGVGTAHGTFGELLQGALPSRNPADGQGCFLVTLPIARWSTARLDAHGVGDRIDVVPVSKTKAASLVEALLEDIGAEAGGSLTLHSSIPEGKGLASSSADLVATARAVEATLQVPISPDRLGMLMAAIEPTDGVMHPGVVAFDHRQGILLRSLGALPALQIVAVDQGGRVDTVAFNKGLLDHDPVERQQYGALLEQLDRAIETEDLAEVGRISTRSAMLNQRRLPNRNIEALRSVCQAVGGLGLVACHSGTMIGVLLDPRTSNYRSQLSQAVHLVEDLPGQTHLYRTLAG